jgi:hypothetical protein
MMWDNPTIVQANAHGAEEVRSCIDLRSADSVVIAEQTWCSCCRLAICEACNAGRLRDASANFRRCLLSNTIVAFTITAF